MINSYFIFWKLLRFGSSQAMANTEAWQRVSTKVPIRSPRYAVFDLAEGKEYKFRVLSANMYGTSEPSKPTSLIETLQLKGFSQPFPFTNTYYLFSFYDLFWLLLCFVVVYKVSHRLLVRWLLQGKQIPLCSSNGLLQRNPTIWLAIILTSVWRGPKTGLQPITNLIGTPSMFQTNCCVAVTSDYKCTTVLSLWRPCVEWQPVVAVLRCLHIYIWNRS